jgi:hypothetical protein
MPRFAQAAGHLGPSIESGSSTAVTTVERSSGSPKSSSPMPARAGARRRAPAGRAGHDAVEALLLDQVERDVERAQERARRGERRGRRALRCSARPRPQSK